MNKMWMIKIDNNELKGWTKSPNIILHDYRELGLTAEEAIFLMDIISKDEEYIFYDTTYMSKHGCSKTLQRRRNALRKKGFLTWERYDKYDSETNSIKSSGFRYDTSKALNKVILYLQKMDKSVSDNNDFSKGQMCPSDNIKRPPTKESYTKESYTKESFNNNPSRDGDLKVASLDGTFNSLENYETNTGETYINIDEYISDTLNNMDMFEDIDDGPDDFDDIDAYAYASFTPPKDNDINAFLNAYMIAREYKHLPKLKNIEKHKKNLKDIHKDELVSLTNSPGVIYSFFDYCDDKSFDMKVRWFECNSDRSPSVMFNESVYRRFLHWRNKN